MIKVFVVDDHPAIRMGVVTVLEGDPEIELVGEAGTLAEARHALDNLSVDVVVADVRLGDGDGIDLVVDLQSEHTEVVAYTQYTNAQTVLRAFRLGVLGYVVKESDPVVLRSAVRHAACHETWIDPRIADKVVTAATKQARAKGPFGLTPQELAVVELLPRGLTNQQIARSLRLSPETVKSHLRNALPKLKAPDRDSAAAVVSQAGLG